MKQSIIKNFYLNANELEIAFIILVDRYIYTGEQLNKHSI